MYAATKFETPLGRTLPNRFVAVQIHAVLNRPSQIMGKTWEVDGIATDTRVKE
jgi:hypothetical protein